MSFLTKTTFKHHGQAWSAIGQVWTSEVKNGESYTGIISETRWTNALITDPKDVLFHKLMSSNVV